MAVTGNPIPQHDDPIVDHTQLQPGVPPTPVAVDSASAGQPTTPSGFGGVTNGTASTTSGFSGGSSTFGTPAAGGFGSSGGFGLLTPSSGFGSTPSSGFGGGFGAPAAGGFGSGSLGGNSMSGTGNQGQYQQVDTSAFSNAIAASADKPEEHWMKSFWRPAMGWLYMLTCMCDFIVFPVLWSMMQAYIHGAVQQQWNPITLQGAGLYHLAMGAILGIAAYGRTKEKTTGSN